MTRQLYSQQELDILTDRTYKRTEALYKVSFAATNAGRRWYRQANTIAGRIAREFDIDISRAAGAMAVLSPQIDWHDAVLDTFKICWGDTENFLALPYNVEKAYKIIHQGDFSHLKGKKVTAFYDNIVKPHSSQRVTLDTHMARIYGIHPDHLFERKGVYEAVEEGVLKYAHEMNKKPHEIQATLWVAWQGSRTPIPKEST